MHLLSDEFHAMQQRAILQMKEMQSAAKPASAPNETSAPAPPEAAPLPAKRGRGLFSRFFNMETDTALILPLLLLLGREGADEGLLLALLYIML